MPIVLNGTTGITTPTYNGSTTAEYLVPVTGFKNRIINGDMTIDQRNAGASVTIPANAITYTIDRWAGFATQASKFSVQQDAGAVTPPAGFTDYLGVTSLAATSVGSADQFQVLQAIEGFNIADLGWGTANAKTVTISFWVRSSLTGTFGGSLRNAGGIRSYPFSYTISSANTWEQKSVTIAGDTSGTWVTNNGVGVYLGFGLGVGSTLSSTAGSWSTANYVSTTGATSVVGTNGATFYITGVQFEVGSNATSFDYLPYGTELVLCQRYYFQYVKGTNQSIAIGTYYLSSAVFCVVQFPVTMRATPTLSSTTGTNFYGIYRDGASDLFNSLSFDGYQHTNSAILTNQTEVSGTAGQSGFISATNSSSAIGFQAEL